MRKLEVFEQHIADLFDPGFYRQIAVETLDRWPWAAPDFKTGRV
jgi:hypothetical protein